MMLSFKIDKARHYLKFQNITCTGTCMQVKMFNFLCSVLKKNNIGGC